MTNGVYIGVTFLESRQGSRKTGDPLPSALLRYRKSEGRVVECSGRGNWVKKGEMKRKWWLDGVKV
jgi:hypothetical protein